MTEDPFLEYRDRPSPDTLVGFLRGCQGTVYRLCYHVLQNAHDAEDAAQQVLLKIVEARRFDDRDRFQRWLYRVCLNAALEAGRKASRRRAHESRAAMERTEPVTLNPDQRLVLFEAMAGLDDLSRTFLLEHYFEGLPLESIAGRSGYTASGVSRRIDKARDSMRKRLGGAAALPALETLFTQTPAPPDLVTGAVLAQATSTAALAAAGGIAMTSKGTLVAAVAITALISLGVGTGLGVAINRRIEPRPEPSATPAPVQVVVPKEHAVRTAEKAAPVAPETPKVSSLTARLNRYKAFKDASRREWESRGSLSPEALSALMVRRRRDDVTELDGLFTLAFEEPEVFLAFLSASENEPYLEGFLIKALGLARLEPGHIMIRGASFKDYPAALTEGLFELARIGGRVPRSEALAFFGRLSGMPAEYGEYFRSLLDDPDPATQVAGIELLQAQGRVTGPDLKALREMGSKSSSDAVRSKVIASMRYSEEPEATDYLFERLEAPGNAREFVEASMALGHKFTVAKMGASAHPVSGDRYLAAVSSRWNLVTDENSFKAVVYNVLEVPGDKVRDVLVQGLAAAPGDRAKDLVAGILRKMDEGETNREALKKMVYGR